VIDIQGLQLQLGPRRLLDIATLRIGAQERVALVGPNGAGKSTLLRVLAGQAPAPWQGRVELLGQALAPTQLLRERARLAVVPQGAPLVGRLSARDNVLTGALARCGAWGAWGFYPASIEAEADAWLDRLALRRHAHTRADKLSGGERQRVAIARAALQRPLLLLADEATAQLDPRAAEQACAWLQQAAGSGALVTVLHQLELLPLVATRVIGLRDGRIVLDAAVDDSPALQQALRALYRAAPADDATAAADAPHNFHPLLTPSTP
jgi:phosphonate transport system ATP-binding protein